MIYLDSGATSFPKPPGVVRAMETALRTCANPGRGGYPAAEAASRTVYRCREQAGKLFQCRPEQVILTGSCTHGLNIAIRTLVKPGARVAVSGFEHNAVTRPLHALDARLVVCGRRLFDQEDTLSDFRRALRSGVAVTKPPASTSLQVSLQGTASVEAPCSNASSHTAVISSGVTSGRAPSWIT